MFRFQTLFHRSNIRMYHPKPSTIIQSAIPLLLENQFALITGGGKGLGKSIALELAENGCNVIIVGRHEKSLQQVVSQLPLKIPSQTHCFYKCDISKENDVQELFSNLKSQNEQNSKQPIPLNLLINNASINRDGILLRFSESNVKEMIETNIMGTIRVTQAFVKYVFQYQASSHHNTNTIALHSNKSIVSIGSVVGNVTGGNIGQTIYSMTKSSLQGFTKSLAKELGSRNIRVNMVAPGFIENTDMTAVIPNEIRDSVKQGIILQQRFGTSEEIAKAVRFLSSQEASYITGQMLVVDGGLSI